MLDVIRNLVKSIAGKILLLIMVASFAVWGMGDLLTSGDSGLVAKVGNQKITVNEFYTQFRKKLSEFNQSLDKPLTELEAHNQQITYLVLNEMVYGKLVQEFANNNSLFLSDEILKKAIVSIPQFQDENGKFNKILFDNTILNNFNNEEQFTNEISKIFLNNLIFENFSIPALLNEEISNTFYQYEYETRDIVYFNLTKSLISNQNVSDSEITNYYNENSNETSLPLNQNLENNKKKNNKNTQFSTLNYNNIQTINNRNKYDYILIVNGRNKNGLISHSIRFNYFSYCICCGNCK